MICTECGTKGAVGEYHPRGFCVLYNAGIDPYEFFGSVLPHIAPELLETCAAVIRYDDTGGRDPFRETVDLARTAVKNWGGGEED